MTNFSTQVYAVNDTGSVIGPDVAVVSFALTVTVTVRTRVASWKISKLNVVSLSGATVTVLLNVTVGEVADAVIVVEALAVRAALANGVSVATSDRVPEVTVAWSAVMVLTKVTEPDAERAEVQVRVLTFVPEPTVYAGVNVPEASETDLTANE